jgi:hypothetical protein
MLRQPGAPFFPAGYIQRLGDAHLVLATRKRNDFS